MLQYLGSILCRFLSLNSILCCALAFILPLYLLKVATPEGVVRDSSEGDDGNVNDDRASSSDDDDDGLDALEQARRAARRHCGWVPSTSNGVEVRCIDVYVWCRKVSRHIL